MDIVYNEKTKEWEERKPPFAVIEFRTKEDFDEFKAILKICKTHKNALYRMAGALMNSGEDFCTLCAKRKECNDAGCDDEFVIPDPLVCMKNIVEYFKDENFENQKDKGEKDNEKNL